ncbi:MAG TPA: rubrerythrin family protein [Treponemataceae bacterium]|nr:rubrerythrin family protein [Treponemataceae bacterium]
MKSVKGTQTEKNLLAAFMGESQARNRYTFWASKAKEEGYVAIQKVFLETADQEKEHAKRLFKFLEGGELTIQAGGDAGIIGTTLQNLKQAAHGENYEWQTMYPEFAKTAHAEGFPTIGTVMENIAVAEKFHAKRYEGFAKHIEDGDMWIQESATEWRCINCGFIYVGKEAPKMCPACAHPQAYFERSVENW